MAILKHVWKIPLDPGGAGSTLGETISELSVVREDRNPEILFSVMETRGPVRRRITFALNTGQAMGLARFLGAITTMKVEPPEEPEELTPTRPGREGED